MKRFEVLRTVLKKKFLQIDIYQEAVAIVSSFFSLGDATLSNEAINFRYDTSGWLERN